MKRVGDEIHSTFDEITHYDLDDLIGFIAEEANHTDDKKIDRLFERLPRILEKEIDNQ